MKKRSWHVCVLVLVLVLAFGSTVEAAGGKWKFPMGISFISGFKDVVDFYEIQGGVTPGYVPIGAVFSAYYQMDNGVGIEGGFGPLMFIFGDFSFFNAPVFVGARFTLSPKAPSSFYVKAGGKFNIATGDYVDSMGIGFYGGAGYQFRMEKNFGMALECTYDTSTITFLDYYEYDVKPTKITISFLLVF